MNVNQSLFQLLKSSLICAILLLGLSSCKKAETVVPTVDSIFSMVDSELVDEVFPEPSGKDSNQPVITSVQGNGSVLAGGTNLITVNFEDPQDDAIYVLVSMEGEDGYFRNNIPSGSNVSLTMLLDQSLIQNAISILFSIEDKKGNVSEPYIVPIKRVDAGTGNLQVSLSWDIDNDLDLHLVQPDGEEIYYGNDASGTGGLLDTDSNAACWIDGVRNENITYGEGAVVLAGDYIVRVDNYEECLFGGAKTNFSVVAYVEGKIVATTSGSNPGSGVFLTGTSDFGEEGSGVDAMQFNVPQQIGKKDVVVIDYDFTARQRRAANNPKLQ
ncbi:hypothetical protein N9933_02140 [bacterium]|nr:hypothetical protein [bacterium]